MNGRLQVEECPKCSSRTFVIQILKEFGNKRKCKCHKCGHDQEIWERALS